MKLGGSHVGSAALLRAANVRLAYPPVRPNAKQGPRQGPNAKQEARLGPNASLAVFLAGSVRPGASGNRSPGRSGISGLLVRSSRVAPEKLAGLQMRISTR
jgi:hypothetical protein